MLKPDTLALTALLALLTALGPLSTDMYLPSLPALGLDLGATTAQVQYTLSAFLAGFAGGQILWGPLADRRGRKPILMAGLAIYCFASLACAGAASVEVLTIARFFQAFGAAAPIVLARSVARDLYDGARAGQELARMGSFMGLVPAVAPLIGGILEMFFGWRSSFFASLIFGLLAGLLVRFGLPETIKTRVTDPLTPGRILSGFAGIWASPVYRPHAALVCLTYGGLFAFISGSSFVLQSIYGLSVILYGIAFGLCAAAYVVGTLIGQRVVRRIGIAGAIRWGAVLLAAGGLLMIAGLAIGFGHPAEIVAPMMLYMVGVGIGLPQTQAGALMPFPDRAGTASSLTGFLQMTFGAFVGIGVGHQIGTSAWPLVAVIAAMGVAALVVEVASRKARGV